jgi:regulator of protease activity HflC (stomatin/prohibitin superfamily)
MIKNSGRGDRQPDLTAWSVGVNEGIAVRSRPVGVVGIMRVTPTLSSVAVSAWDLRYNPRKKRSGHSGRGGVLMGLSAIATIIAVLYLLSSIKILAEYERGVIFRLGRLLGHEKGPGLILVFAPIDRMVRISLRQEALEVPPQDIITRDNVTLKVNAVIFLRVIDPRKAVVEVSNYVYQTSQFAQTTLRSVLGEQDLDELLSHREKINLRLQSILDTHTAPWGVKVTNVEVKQVDMPESMLRAMAKQAEAEREKRSKIIHAEGEFSAAQRLVDAAALLAKEPVSVQLRYLQTLTEIGVEKNTTVVFPVPVDFFSGMQKILGTPGAEGSKK